MAEANIREPEMGLTFEKVWAALMETDRVMKEQMAEQRKEIDRIIKEAEQSRKEAEQSRKEREQARKESSEEMKETEWAMKKSSEELKEQMKETDRKISRLGSRLGELIEDLTASNLVEKVNELGYQFTKISRNSRIKDEKNHVKAEIDILLEDGDYAMVVEVKTNLTKTDVMEHLQRMETLRRHADIHGDKRKYVSSVAGALIEDGAREYALEQGLYVIEHPGQTIEIVAPPRKREW